MPHPFSCPYRKSSMFNSLDARCSMGNFFRKQQSDHVPNSLENNSTGDNGEPNEMDKPQISSDAARSTTEQSITNHIDTIHLQTTGNAFVCSNVAKQQHEPKEKAGADANGDKDKTSYIGNNSPIKQHGENDRTNYCARHQRCCTCHHNFLIGYGSSSPKLLLIECRHRVERILKESLIVPTIAIGGEANGKSDFATCQS